MPSVTISSRAEREKTMATAYVDNRDLPRIKSKPARQQSYRVTVVTGRSGCDVLMTVLEPQPFDIDITYCSHGLLVTLSHEPS